MRVTFLGTNGWFNTNIANTSCVLIETQEAYVVFDAGEGIYKLERLAVADKPVHLFITHLHLDHITGLHVFNRFKFSRGMTIYGETGIEEALRVIARKPYSVDVDNWGYPVHFKDLSEGRYDFGFGLEALALKHSVSCLGYRLESAGKSVSYLADTGVCDNAVSLSRGVDICIAECALPAGEVKPDWPHLNPHTAAQIAKTAGAKKLYLTHFNPAIFPGLTERDLAQEQAREIFPATVAARDGLVVEI